VVAWLLLIDRHGISAGTTCCDELAQLVHVRYVAQFLCEKKREAVFDGRWTGSVGAFLRSLWLRRGDQLGELHPVALHVELLHHEVSKPVGRVGRVQHSGQRSVSVKPLHLRQAVRLLPVKRKRRRRYLCFMMPSQPSPLVVK
jgi:hypothetical protein